MTTDDIQYLSVFTKSVNTARGILPFDERAASPMPRSSRVPAIGQAISIADGQIGAIALANGFAVATARHGASSRHRRAGDRSLADRPLECGQPAQPRAKRANCRPIRLTARARPPIAPLAPAGLS